MRKNEINYALYLVTDRKILAGRDLYECVEQAILGGTSLLQLREKDVSSKDFYEIAQRVKVIAAKYKVPFIINDRLDIALAVDADGLHIGQDDMPLSVARKLLGPDKIIGMSASSISEALTAEKEGADYLGVGAMFTTPTKKDADSVTLSQLAKIKAAVHIPVVAIGGINEDNVKSVINTGVDGVSVVSAILGKHDIQGTARKLLTIIHA